MAETKKETTAVVNNISELNSKLRNEQITKRFHDMLGKKSVGFITSITNIVQNNSLLAKADTNSIILAASQAAALDLPISPSLGLAALVPYNDTKNNRCLAQFQMMRNGWMELAQRSQQFEYIANEIVYDGELVYHNRFTDEYQFDETKRRSDTIIGYMASFKLLNGYHKTIYWTVEQCKAHGMRYSKTYKQGYGLWATDFNAMALKTVLKHLLVKYAPKSIESINSAIVADQAVFSGDIDNPRMEYSDNPNSNSNENNEVVEFVEADVVEEKKSSSKTKKSEQSNNTNDDEF